MAHGRSHPADTARNQNWERWIQSIGAGDREALAALYHETSPAVYAFSLSILKNVHDAEDVLQECYLHVYQSAAHYRASGKPMAWMLTIARNLCLMCLREREKTVDLPETSWESLFVDNDAITETDRMMLGTCLGQLSEQERTIVVSHAVAGLKHREIAALLDLPLSTVLSKYHRALRKLRTYF